MKSLTFTHLFKEETKYNYEFEEVCADLEKDFGRAVWTLPFKTWCNEYKLREAGKIARKRGVLKFNYLVGIIRKL